MEMDENTQPQEESRPLPAHIRVLKNGSHYDTSIGRLVKGPTVNPITSGNPAEFQRRAIESRKRKARQAMIEAVEQHTGKTGLKSADAYAAIAFEFTGSALANAMDKPRDAVPAAKLALSMADMAPTEQQEQRAPALSLTLSEGAVAFLRGLVDKAGEAIEGQVRDVD